MSTDLSIIKQIEAEIGVKFRDNIRWDVGYRLDEHKRIVSLSLCGVKLERFPSVILQLTKLTSLDLHNNVLTTIPKEIVQLANLKFLYLHDNQIRIIPQELVQLNNLGWLSLDNNPIENIPPEIILQGIDAIIEYLTQQEQIVLNEAKLILVGKGEVGKTCIVNRLLFNTFQEQLSTHGINIRKWTIPASNEIHDEVTLNIWDFGGQEIYHATHQFFLTQRSVYLIVWNARQGKDYEQMHYWLHIVEAFAGDSPIILVLSKCKDHDDDLNMRDIKAEFPQVVDLYKIDNKDGYGISALSEIIRKTAWNLPHMKTRWIKSWFRVRKTLREDGRNWINYAEFYHICKNEGMDEEQITILDRYFHDLGVIIHFHQWEELQDLVILKPEWLTQAFYKILEMESVRNRGGLLLRGELEEIGNTTVYSPKIFPKLLAVMNRFELVYQLEDNQTYLVPELLPRTLPQIDWDDTNNLYFYYCYHFLPAGISTRFIVRMHNVRRYYERDHYENELEILSYWREGMVLKYGGAKAYIKVNPFDKQIVIKISGSRKASLLALIRREFTYIHSSIPKIKVRQEVSCNCSPNCSYRFDYESLLKAEERGKITVDCQETWQEVLVHSLLDGYNEFQPSKEKREQKLKKLINDKEYKLKEAYIIATDPSEKFRLKQEIDELKEILKQIV